jgi:flagellin-like hook-associated protein FlgL
MAINPISLGRVSNLARGNLIRSTVSRTQMNLLSVQQQLTTGKRMAAPSDDAGDAAVAQSIRKILEQREAYKTNIDAANNHLSEVDSSLSTVTDLLRQAQQVASANVGSDVTSDQRTAAAEIVDSIYNQMLSMGNRSANGVYLFAGDRSTEMPFEEENGGVKWVGSSDVLSNVYDEGTTLDFMVDGADIFGALSSRVQGTADLTPSVGADTRLADLKGAVGKGVRPGIIQVSDGTTSATLDLSDADTLGDVVDRINSAGVGTLTAAINAAGDGIDLSAGAGDSITVTNVGGGSAATDLGILAVTSPGAGVPVAGASVGAALNGLTPLASLNGGAGIDLSGLAITNGTVTTNIDFTGAVTVEDILNRINTSDADVKAKINSSGTGIDILNAVQGSQMRIAENGGTSAADLGVRSFDVTTKIADLNNGNGLSLVEGPELKIADSAGVSFDVELDGLETVQDLLDAINTSATTAGAGVTASFGANGLVLTDTAAGAGTMTATGQNYAPVLAELGIESAAVGGVISGTDVAPVESKGIFAQIIRLRNALRNDDQNEITKASENMDGDLERVIRIRGEVGARVQAFEARSESLADQNVTTRAMLSDLEDTDFTDAIIKFQTLQTSLQASMQAAGQTLNLSLMDFLG